jgi:hypothetical protein
MSGTVRTKIAQDAAPIVYGSVAVISSVAYVLLLQESHEFLVVAVPLLCLLSLRWRLFAPLIPAAIFIGILWITLSDINSLRDVNQTLLALVSLVTVATVSRFQTTVDSVARPEVSTRVNYTPSGKSIAATRGLGTGHFVSLALILFGWLAAGIVCGKFIEITNDAVAYQDYAALLRRRVGLIPEAYIGMTLLFTLTLLLWMARAFFSYSVIRQRGGELAAMHLRSELWKWNGYEQRIISKQIRKNEFHRD